MTTSEERPDVTTPGPAPEAPDQPPASTAPASPAPAAGPRGFDGRTIEARAEAFGRETEAAFERLAKSPAIEATVDVGSRVWGLILLAFGVWFLADVTLDLDLPAVAWRDLWPLALIALGLVIVLRGATRRS